MDPDAIALREYMSDISGKAYCAGWVEHLEYALWWAIVNGPMKYGRYEITQNDIETLRKLCRRCEGWIYFDDDKGGESWTSLADWQDRFNRNVELVKME